MELEGMRELLRKGWGGQRGLFTYANKSGLYNLGFTVAVNSVLKVRYGLDALVSLERQR